MRIELEGIHRVPMKLADGTEKIYWYAWRGGPRLRGEEGTPEFVASYNAAVAQRAPAPEGTLQTLIDAYQATDHFRTRQPRTKQDYIRQIKIIEQEFGDFPLKALAARETRGVFMDWRDRLCAQVATASGLRVDGVSDYSRHRTRSRQDHVNPAKGAAVYNGTRVEFVWSVENEAAFLQHAPTHLRLPLLLALWTGQRQGDLARSRGCL